MSAAKDTTTTTSTVKTPSEGEGAKETKTVETVDYRSSAGGQRQDARPVEVVHEYPVKKDDAATAPTKQD